MTGRRLASIPTYADAVRDIRTVIARGGAELEREIETALLQLATIIAARPEIARLLEPIYDRLERELEIAQRCDIRARARRRLEAAGEHWIGR